MNIALFNSLNRHFHVNSFLAMLSDKAVLCYSSSTCFSQILKVLQIYIIFKMFLSVPVVCTFTAAQAWLRTETQLLRWLLVFFFLVTFVVPSNARELLRVFV